MESERQIERNSWEKIERSREIERGEIERGESECNMVVKKQARECHPTNECMNNKLHTFARFLNTAVFIDKCFLFGVCFSFFARRDIQGVR